MAVHETAGSRLWLRLAAVVSDEELLSTVGPLRGPVLQDLMRYSGCARGDVVERLGRVCVGRGLAAENVPCAG